MKLRFSLLLFATIIVMTSCEKSPEEIVVSSVSLSQPTAEMIIGETLQLQVSISPSNATDKSVLWGSSKQSVATVSYTGLVSAISEGASTITVTAGGKSATCQITVSKGTIAVSSIELNKSELSLIEGESETLVVTVKPDDATDKTVKWESSDKDIATVDGNGKVSAVKEGEATIIARADDKSASCKVVVAKKIIAVESIELSKTTLELVEGESEVLTAKVLPDNATDKTVTWSTSDSSIATVEEGKVIAIKEGEATITAKGGDKTANCKVVVKHDSSNDAIIFADAKIKEKLVAAFDTNGDGELSYKEAAIVTSIEGVFCEETSFTAFEEFQYFIHVTAIPNNMFKSWNRLKSIILPNALKSIGDSAFDSCLSLKGITIPETTTSIGNNAFSSCVRLQSIMIPHGVTGLGMYGFSDCSALESIILPNSLIGIGWGALSGCTNLKSIELPENLESIGISCFHGCGLESISLPSKVQIVSNSAFEGCSHLSTVSFSNPLTVIENNAFKDCYNLIDINLPTSLKTLPFGVFWGCSRLQTITVPEKLTTIENSAFWGCSSLKTIVLPSGIVSIGGEAFYRCSKLAEITVLATVPPILNPSALYIYMDWDAKYHSPDSIFVPEESIEDYKQAEGWKQFSDRIKTIH